MNYKIIDGIISNFELDSKYEVWLVVRDSAGHEKKRIPVVNPIDKGYIYAALYFADDVKREVEKLKKMVLTIRDDVVQESPSLDAPIKMLYISNRVKEVTGNDGLDALIKEILAEDGRHIALVPDKSETEKYEKIKDAIFDELMNAFIQQTLRSTIESGGGKRRFSLPLSYIEKMSEKQKAIFAPAVKMAAFMYGFRLNDFELLPNFTVICTAQKLPEPFAAQEEEIKSSIKKLIASSDF